DQSALRLCLSNALSHRSSHLFGARAGPGGGRARASRSLSFRRRDAATCWFKQGYTSMSNPSEEGRAILESLGLVPVINAAGYPSRLGGATLSPAVRAAMNAAAQHFVPIAEMQERASSLISAATGAGAGCVAAGGAACLTLAAAACIAGDDPAAIDRLPDTTGLRSEIVVHRAHRNAFDHAIRVAGARFVEFGYSGVASGVGAYRWQLEA